MSDRFRDILVVDLLGGLGDLVMVLPVVHALARRHPGARLRLLTHAPGDVLVRTDPAVTEVHRAEPGGERAAVRAELDRRRPDLVVSTTRHSGIPDEIAARGLCSVTDLWRRPPPDQPVTSRYLQHPGRRGNDRRGRRARRPTAHPPDRRRAPGRRRRAGHARRGGPARGAHPRRRNGGEAVAALGGAGRSPRGSGPCSPGGRRAGPGEPGRSARPGRFRPRTCAGWPRCSPRSAAAAAPSSVRTPGRCGWPRRSGHARSACSGRRPPPATASRHRRSTCRGCRAARTAGPPPSPSRCAGGRPAARSPRPARPAWPTSRPETVLDAVDRLC